MIDFWAPWCGPCKVLTPLLEELSTEQSKVEIVKCNVDDNPALSSQFNIRGIPTVLVFNKGEHVDTHVGMAPKGLFESKINEL